MTAHPASVRAVDDAQSLLDSLLYSVSHDLRSPLLTMSLSADLLEEGTKRDAADGSAAVALGALRDGAKDLERMLQALALLSRARRAQVQPGRAPLQMILGGHMVVSDVDGLDQLVVAVSPLVVRDALDALSGEAPMEVHARREGGFAVLSVAVKHEVGDATSPLAAIAGSLQRHAGTVIERLAVAQVLLDRQGAAVLLEGPRLVLRLPVAGAGS